MGQWFKSLYSGNIYGPIVASRDGKHLLQEHIDEGRGYCFDEGDIADEMLVRIPPKLDGMEADECRVPGPDELWYDCDCAGVLCHHDPWSDHDYGRRRWIKTPSPKTNALNRAKATAGATMPTITLWQPWASFIAWGWKTIETRGHNRFARLVGQRIAIHAGQKRRQRAFSLASGYIKRFQPAESKEAFYLWGAAFMDNLRRKPLPQGCILATAFVRYARPLINDGRDSSAALCPCYPELYGLFLEDIQPLKTPIPYNGHSGIFHVPLEIVYP